MVRQTVKAVRSGTTRTLRTKTVAPLAGVTVLVAVLVGCTATPEESEVPQTTQSVQPATADETSEPETCRTHANLAAVYDDTGKGRFALTSELRDLGPREFAAGDVEVDEAGNIVSYTVAEGDVDAVIGERLCGGGFASMNHVRTIYPGQVLWLSPDPETPVLPYFSPTDAPAGFSDIPYRQTMERMGLAVDAGDIDAVRAIWNDELSEMFFNQAEIDSVVAALDAGDLDALRQMFS